jgi:hypothetical protein
VYGALADVVALTHGLLILCVVSGSVAAVAGLLRRRPRLAAAFYTLILLVIASDRLLGDCALTQLEQSLRNDALPGSAYRGSFIGHYFGFLPPFVHHWIGPAIIVAALAAYPCWWWVDRRVRAENRPQAAR